jgi:hypothetical protein
MRPFDSDRRVSPDAARDRGSRCFALGGVAFEIEPEPGLSWQLPALDGLVLPLPAATHARARCRLQLDSTLQPLAWTDGTAAWQERGAGVSVCTAELALELRARGVGEFEVDARIASERCIAQLMVLLAASVIELAGGLCLHATAVEWDGAALLLLGPSGAGKTTASQLLGDVRCLANDRVAVWETPAGFGVWALPGGSPPLLARSPYAALPVAAFLRVLQAPERCSLRRLRMGEAALYLREAIEVGVGSGFLEGERLERVSAFACAAVGGSVSTVLGRPWARELRTFLQPSAAISQEGAS